MSESNSLAQEGRSDRHKYRRKELGWLGRRRTGRDTQTVTRSESDHRWSIIHLMFVEDILFDFLQIGTTPFQSRSQKRPGCIPSDYRRSRRAAVATVSIIKVTERNIDSIFMKLRLWITASELTKGHSWIGGPHYWEHVVPAGGTESKKEGQRNT